MVTGAHWAGPAAAVRAANGWPACAARCGWPMDPAGQTDQNGHIHDRHPDCETNAQVIPFRPRTTRHQPGRRTA